MATETAHVFVSYSQQDIFWLNRLTVHLRPLVRKFGLDVWSDTRLEAGADWQGEIDAAIRKARVAILLVSADFLGSDFIADNELPPLLEKAEREGTLILPVVVSPCRFLETRELSQFQSVNNPSRPLLAISKAEQEHVFLNLAIRIEKELKRLSPLGLTTADRSPTVSKATTGPVIKAVGIGGGGCNTIEHIAERGLKGVELTCLNTDVQALTGRSADHVIQIGKNLTRGLGAGGDPKIGNRAALESEEEIRNLLAPTDLLFVTAGMGGGTGTGGIPVLTRIAKDLGVLCVAVVTKPFGFEGKVRSRVSSTGIKDLLKYVDSLIVIPNDRVFAVVDSQESLHAAFARVNEVLRWIVEGISYLLLQPGLINVDFADLRTAMKAKGYAKMGTGIISKETATAREAALTALENPLTEDLVPGSEQSVLVNVVGGEDLTIGDIELAGAEIGRRFPEATVITGTAISKELKGEIRVTVVATGYTDVNSELTSLSGTKMWTAE
ncbi:MAG: cell division protein FtsZ [Acidobacteriota bacterium]